LATTPQSSTQEPHSRLSLSRAGALSAGALQQPLSQAALASRGSSPAAGAQQRTNTPARQSIGAATRDHTTVMTRMDLTIALIVPFGTWRTIQGIESTGGVGHGL
jgi:hypothetical protein